MIIKKKARVIQIISEIYPREEDCWCWTERLVSSGDLYCNSIHCDVMVLLQQYPDSRHLCRYNCSYSCSVTFCSNFEQCDIYSSALFRLNVLQIPALHITPLHSIAPWTEDTGYHLIPFSPATPSKFEPAWQCGTKMCLQCRILALVCKSLH